ncbi:MAG: DUF4430 domain-containing protein [Syntrophomonas sp.]
MNKKRAFYLLALLLILAAIIVPTVVDSNHSGSGQLAKTDTSVGVTGDTPAPEKAIAVEDKAATQSPAATSETKYQTEQTESAPEAPVKADSPVQNPPEQPGCRVYIAVVGLKGEILYPPAAVNVTPGNRWGITALGALDATGLSYGMKPMWPDFVDSIGGQACKGVSGWMYMVNGEIPMHLADKHPVKDGDKVIWWFSESMDQEPPSWDKLKK